MNINEIRQSNYLKREDARPDKLVTIRLHKRENIEDNGQPKLKSVLFFNELEKPLVLNWINAEAIARITGSDDTDNWTGHKIVLYDDENVMMGTKRVGGIRVRAPRLKAPAGTPVTLPTASAPMPFVERSAAPIADEDVPF